MIMNERPYIEKRDLHIGGMAPRKAADPAASVAAPSPRAAGPRHEWGLRASDFRESNDMENGMVDGNEGFEEVGDAGRPDHQWSEEWVGDGWVGEAWDQPAGEGLLADAQNALTLVDDYVRSRPWQTLAIVALVSLGLGYGLASARSRR